MNIDLRYEDGTPKTPDEMVEKKVILHRLNCNNVACENYRVNEELTPCLHEPQPEVTPAPGVSFNTLPGPFITLHRHEVSGVYKPCDFNTDQICAVLMCKQQFTNTEIYTNAGLIFEVKETRDEICKLIAAKNNPIVNMSLEKHNQEIEEIRKNAE